MRRTLLATTALALVAGGAVAVASAAPGSEAVRRPVAVGCAGPSSVLLPTGSCVHTTDVLPVGAAAAKPPAGVKPTCYADGQSGARVQLVYGYVSGAPNRAKTVVPRIRSVMAPRMEGVVRRAAEGKDLGIRFAFDGGCKQLSVLAIAFPRGVIGSDDPNQQFSKMITHLRSLGLNRGDRKYLVIWDHWNDKSICGLGELWAPELPDPVAVSDGRLTDSSTPKFSAVWSRAFSPRGPSCWELGPSGALVQVHELLHTLGAVQPDAPHSDGDGHCLDGPSTMCPGPGVAACERMKAEPLDCRNDDYWDPSPAQGSYLDTNRNLARSRFFGPQLEDSLPVQPAP